MNWCIYEFKSVSADSAPNRLATFGQVRAPDHFK